ncbi:hypothetical protein ACJJIR_01260 [Microbulbifer sp. SSSA008]|uniref:hypothetical protein n=1 Tax=Microbulbifer sp. SSSA008 TaxID=3243380 RepID=UPI00403A143A
MREAHLQILDPIWKVHPELLAQELGEEYKIDKNMYLELQSLVKKYAYNDSES